MAESHDISDISEELSAPGQTPQDRGHAMTEREFLALCGPLNAKAADYWTTPGWIRDLERRTAVLLSSTQADVSTENSRVNEIPK